MEQIVSRTSEYAKNGIYVLWLALYQAALEENRYSPSACERWVHAAYGRMAFPEIGRTGVEVTNGYSADLVVKALGPASRVPTRHY
jgi:hypothetical protein